VNDALAGRAATGMCLVRVGGHAGSVGGPALLLYVVNWRTRRVSSVCPASGQLLRSFTCAEFVEPTALAVVAPSALSSADDAGSAAAVRIFVADNGARRLLVFSGEGRLVDSVALDRDEATARSPDHPRGGGAATGALVTCLYAVPPPAAEILVCSDRLRALSYAGEFLYELTPGNASPGQVRAGGRGQYGGVVVDARGRYLASRCRQRCGLLAVIEIYSSERRWMFNIECDSPRLRRPAGLAVHCHPADVSAAAAAAAAAAGGPHSGGDDDDDDAWWVVASSYVYVADLGNNAVRKFRYA